MARPSIRFLRPLYPLLLVFLGLLCTIGVAIATPHNADTLVNLGLSQFNAGQFSAALQTWQQAERRYRQSGNSTGIIGTKINQSLAQQGLGQDLSACYTITEAMQLEADICRGKSVNLANIAHHPATPIALKSLADSLNALGYSDMAEIVVKQALQVENQAELWISLGTIYAQSGQTKQAIVAYQTAIYLAEQQQQWRAVSNAKINLLGLQAIKTKAEIDNIDLSVFTGISKAQAHLKLTKILEKQLPNLAIAQAQVALSIGNSLNHPRTIAAALGLMANIQQQLGKPDISLTQQAIAIAQSVRAWDLAFPAQTLLAQIYTATDQSPQAIRSYQAAIYSLNQLRQQLKGTANQRQFDFYKQIEPIYHQYLELLFDQPKSTEEVIQANSQLQMTELENFLGCPLTDWQRIEQVEQTPDTTLIFIVRGTNRYHIILRSFNQPDYRYSIAATALEPIVFNLMTNIETGQLDTIRPETISHYGQRLYDVLLKPAAAKLAGAGTLAFVLDSTLQNLPIDCLHDGQDYLLRKYSFSVTLGAQLRQPKSLSPEQFNVLLAGISETAPSFDAPINPLTQTKNELISIKQNTAGKILLNQDFTIERLKQALNQGQYPIVHLSTHGTFSSDPKITGLFAWDRKIGLTELHNLIKQQSQRQQAIELLVLSACETATGDQRSILGLAGVAAQAGARSTVASLWVVDESSTATLMEIFYSGLRAGLSKAEALRQAKLALIDSERYQHPFFWGSFILLGSWL